MPTADAADWGFASELEDVSGAVAIVGIGDADYTRASGRTTRKIAAQATERALADAGLRPSDVDGLMYVPFSGDQFTARDFRAHFGTYMRPSTSAGRSPASASARSVACAAISRVVRPDALV